MSVFYLGSTNSDLTGGSDFSKYLETVAETAGSITISVVKSATETSYAFTRANIPNNADWQTGTITVEANVTSANAYIYLSVNASRVDSTGAVQESATATSEQLLDTTGVKTFTIASKDWTAGNATDRLRIAYIFRNSRTTSAQSVTIATGTTDTEVTSSIAVTVNKSITAVQADAPAAALGATIAAVKNISLHGVQAEATAEALAATVAAYYSGYLIQKKIGTGTYNTLSTVYGLSSADYTDTSSFVGDTTYYYQIKRVANDRSSNWSTEVSVTYSAGVQITVTNYTASKISDETGMDSCTVTFRCSQDILAWEARATNEAVTPEYGVGLLVGSGSTSVSANTNVQFIVDDEELTQGDRTYTVRVYVKDTDQVWH